MPIGCGCDYAKHVDFKRGCISLLSIPMSLSTRYAFSFGNRWSRAFTVSDSGSIYTSLQDSCRDSLELYYLLAMWCTKWINYGYSCSAHI